MNIEKAFAEKFSQILPSVKLYPLAAPVETKTLTAVYQVRNRNSETDLSNMKQTQSCNIVAFLFATKYDEVVESTWTLINGFEIALGAYLSGAPDIQQVEIISSKDEYNPDLQIYQSATEMKFYF